MAAKRKIEVFSAGCLACSDTIEEIRKASCPSCEVSVIDMHKHEVADRAKKLGIRSIPAVLIDGKLADCCSSRGIDVETLKAAGLGKPIS